MIDLSGWLLAACGLAVVGIGVFFLAFRPALLPEDRRYIGAADASLDALPGLGRWLQKVFRVMGGYMVASGVLTVYLGLADVRDGSNTAWAVAAAAGVASVGLMAVINVRLRSDFRWPLLALAALWASAVLLAAFGS